jgi:hypothetical protein
MKRKLLLLAGALTLTFFASTRADAVRYIICETCTTSDAIYPCQCGSGSLHPSALSNCNAWFGDCYG